jgi:hypothetical protein
MRILPQRSEDRPPPAIEHLGGLLRDSRVGRWVGRHKNGTAAVAGLLAVAKLWKYAIFDFVRVITHPGATVHWILGHLLLTLGVSVAVFTVAFVVARLGLDWFSRDEAAEPARPGLGPSWQERPPNPRADTYTPRGF